ncbi:MAG: hypothetical protein U1E31_00750 [Rickettsiales bacterium]
MLNTEFLIKNINKCFKNVPRDILQAVKLRQAKEFNFDNFILQLKNKVKSNFEFYFKDICKVYFDEVPNILDHEYIAISLSESDLKNLENGLDLFGFVILYRNFNYKLSIIYIPSNQEKIIIKNENFYKEDISENLHIIKINKRNRKTLAVDTFSDKIKILIEKLAINQEDVLILRSQIYSLFLLMQGKIDIVYFNTNNSIIHAFLEHMLQNLVNKVNNLDIALIKQSKSEQDWISAYENGDYIINFSNN